MKASLQDDQANSWPHRWEVYTRSNYYYWIGNGTQGHREHIGKANEIEKKGRMEAVSPQLSLYTVLLSEIMLWALLFLARHDCFNSKTPDLTGQEPYA